jgi:DNA-binding MarR family transcriptional regulator
MTEIASRIHRDKSTTTVLVKKLEKEGYVERIKNQDDNRSFYLKLTEKGLQYTKVTSEISSKLVSKAYENFSEEEKEATYALLSRICDNFMIG